MMKASANCPPGEPSWTERWHRKKGPLLTYDSHLYHDYIMTNYVYIYMYIMITMIAILIIIIIGIIVIVIIIKYHL